MKRILAIEDCDESLVLIRSALGPLYDIKHCPNGQEARAVLGNASDHPDLLLLDISLPDGDGLKLLSLLRTEDLLKELPVIVVSGHADIANKVTAFSLGAEDFIAKPFHPTELRARIEARLRRAELAQQAKLQQLSCGNVSIDIERQHAYTGQDPRVVVDLTPKEFRLLCALIRANGRILTREQLLQDAWGEGTHVVDRAIDTHISRLRGKLRGALVQIEAVPGQGYRICAITPEPVDEQQQQQAKA